MEIILSQDVKGSGKKGDQINVKDGYARHLIAAGKAVVATAQNKNDRKTQEDAKKYHAQMEFDKAKKIAEKIDGKTVQVHVRAGNNGKLFGSVTAKEVAAALTTFCGEEITKKKVSLTSDIKAFGLYTCEVKLYAGVAAKAIIEVTE